MIDYNKTRDDAAQRKAELVERQQRLAVEINKLAMEAEENRRELIGLDQILDGLDFVSGDVASDSMPIGFTDNIRKLLKETPVPLIPTQIRDSLQARGIVGSSAKNLLINVHKVLERIEPELIASTTTDGKTAYKHKAGIRPSRNQAPVVDLMAALKASLAEGKKATMEEGRKARMENLLKRADAIKRGT
jgi:hypothetical protein